MLGALSSFSQIGRILMPLIYGVIMEHNMIIPFFMAAVFQVCCVTCIVLIPTNAYQPLSAATVETAQQESSPDVEPGMDQDIVEAAS